MRSSSLEGLQQRVVLLDRHAAEGAYATDGDQNRQVILIRKGGGGGFQI